MQLSRPDYEATNKVLMLAGGKWNRGAKAHVFATDPRPTLLGAVESGAIVDKKKLHQAYYTPGVLADQLVQDAKLTAGHRILEPSCGAGAIASAIFRRVGYWPDCVDNDAEAIAAVTKLGATRAWKADFLAWAETSINTYDRIVMNPPFTGGQDMAHVAAAIGLLKPGGRLVAVMSMHWTFAEDKRTESFRELLDFWPDNGRGSRVQRADGVSEASWTPHPEGSFKESGTGVATGHLVYVKPSAARAALADDGAALAATVGAATPASTSAVSLRKVYPKNRPR
jgi:predicted RNA methylase